MGRKAPLEKELLKRALANGFKPNAYRETNAERDQGKYINKIIRDQDRIFTRYIT